MPSGYPSNDPQCTLDVFDGEDYAPCGLTTGHIGQCRTRASIDARNARKRAKYKRVVEAHGGTVGSHNTEGRKWTASGGRYGEDDSDF